MSNPAYDGVLGVPRNIHNFAAISSLRCSSHSVLASLYSKSGSVPVFLLQCHNDLTADLPITRWYFLERIITNILQRCGISFPSRYRTTDMKHGLCQGRLSTFMSGTGTSVVYLGLYLNSGSTCLAREVTQFGNTGRYGKLETCLPLLIGWLQPQ